MSIEIEVPSEEEMESMLASMSDTDQHMIKMCVEELNDMVEQYGEDVLIISTMVVSANLAREQPAVELPETLN